MNSSIQFRTMAKSFWKLPLDLKKEKRERETPFNLARPSFLRGPYEIFHPIQNSFAWIPEAFISTPPSGAPVPFNKNRGKQRTALKRGEGEAWKKRGGGFFLLAKERVGREEWMAEREKIESHTGKRRNYIAGASMYNLPWRKGEMEGWQGCRAYFRGWVYAGNAATSMRPILISLRHRFRRGNACFSHHFSSLLFPFSCCLSSEGYIRDLKIRKRNCRFTINYNLLISRRGSNNNSNNKFRSILFVLSRNREHVDVTVSNWSLRWKRTDIWEGIS